MKFLFVSLFCFFGFVSNANAGMFDNVLNAANGAIAQVKEATKQKEMARVELPLGAIKRKDPRIGKLESLAVQVAIKHKWKLGVDCPSGKYCKQIKKDVDSKAWRIARSKTRSDFAAKAKLPKTYMAKSNRYELVLLRKGF